MIIRKIGIDGFGKFHRTAFEFQPGINLIYGENEAGKTTCEQFLIGMLYDVEKLRGKGAKNDVYNRYYPEYGGKYGGMMEFSIGGVDYRVQRQFRREQKDVHLYELKTGREIPIEKELCNTCSFMPKEQFMETLCMNPGQIRTGNYLREELNRYSHRISASGTAQFDAGEAIRSLLTQKRRNQKKQAKEQLLSLKTELGDFDNLDERKQILVAEEQRLELQIQRLKEQEKEGQEQLFHRKKELEEERKKKILEEYEQEKQAELKREQNKIKLEQWLTDDKVDHRDEKTKQEEEDVLLEEEDIPEGIGLPLIALACLLAGFAGLWQHWMVPAIIMIVVGVILLLFGLFTRNREKNLSDVGSMVQLEGESKQQQDGIKRETHNPYQTLKPEFLEIEERIKKELASFDGQDESSEKVKKEMELIRAKIVDCERELFDNQMKQKYLLEKENNKKHLKNRYQELREEIQKTEESNRATELAVSVLQELSASIYSEFGTSFNQEVSDIMEAITDHRYERVLIDEQMGIQVEQNGKFLGIDHVSLGTTEQIYFAIRMAAGKLFEKGEPLPILIDDVFGSFDEQRLGRTLSFLSECGHPQVFLFTCNSRIRDILINQRTDFSYLEL